MMGPRRIAKRVTIDQVEDGKVYSVSDPATGKYAAVKAEVTPEKTVVVPRSVVLVLLGGTLPVGYIYDHYVIEEAD